MGEITCSAKLAIKASAGNKKMLDDQRRLLAKREQRERCRLKPRATSCRGLSCALNGASANTGYCSVGTALDIAELSRTWPRVERRRIGLREHIKEVGEYDVVVKLHRDVNPRSR